MLKKFFMVIISIMLVFTLTVTKPVNEVKAFAFTTAALYTTYVLGGLAIAAMADQGYNDGETTEAIWNGTKEFVSSAGSAIVEDVSTAITQTQLLGKTYVALGSAFWDKTMSKMVEWSQSIKSNTPEATVILGTYTVTDYIIHQFGTSSRDYAVFALPHPIVINGNVYPYYAKNLVFADQYDKNFIHSGLRKSLDVEHTQNLESGMYENVLTVFPAFRPSGGITVTYKEGVQTVGIDLSAPVDHWANQVGDQVDKVLNHSKQQGQLYIPLDGMAAVGAGGIGIAYDSATNNWRDRATGEVYLGDITLDNTFVTPAVDESGATVVNPDISIPKVDVNVKDVPWTVTNDSAITDAMTGETVTTDVDVGTGETTIPVESSPDITKIRWDKLRLSGQLFTTAFPFSLPFDIAKALDAVFGGLTSTDIPDLNIVMFDTNFVIRFPQILKEYLVFIRSMMLIIFDVSLVYAIRKWFGGAS